MSPDEGACPLYSGAYLKKGSRDRVGWISSDHRSMRLQISQWHWSQTSHHCLRHRTGLLASAFIPRIP